MSTVLDYLENNNGKGKIIDENRQSSYRELKDNAKKIASFLCEISQNKAIPIFMDKKIDTLELFFGSLYSGNYYSLINIEYPKDRVESILNTLEANFIISSYEYKERLEKDFSNYQIYYYEDIISTLINEERLLEIRNTLYDTMPVYINFTSGSTGNPKGVVVSHRSIIDFINVFTDTFNINKNDIIANQAPFDFDVSVKDIYSALKTGATLVIVPRKLFSNPTKLLDYLEENNITTMIWAVSALCLITTFHGLDYKVPKTVNKILFSGEVMPSKHLIQWKNALPNCMFVNLYGPTEITCNCLYHIITDVNDLPIGIPFKNENVFLLSNDNKKISEEDKVGEICVKGSSLSLGYYNDLTLTSKVFIQDPTHNKYLDLIYKTGDLAHYKNGKLYFDGRKDFQIKYLGHRIELEEVDKHISNIDGVLYNCTLFFKDKLHLYYVGTIEKRELRILLRQKLPLYMVPTKINKLEEMPLTKNGKIDRKKLREI